MARSRALLSLSTFAIASLGAATASAYCRTTTCDAANPQADCSRDANGCATAGIPLYWGTACIGFGVERDGSPKRHVTYATFDRIVQTAYTQWAATQCGSGRPSFKMWDVGALDCNGAEFNKAYPNANTWLFRDDDWPYVGAFATLALTTVSFSLKTGEILDADVEVNSFRTSITTSDTSPSADLQSIATHEAGHFLGLAHSAHADATMYASYSPGDLSFRSLSSDDQAAICAVYPPGRSVPACTQPATPRNGFTRVCGADAPGSATSGLTQTPASGSCTVSRPGSPRPLGVSFGTLAVAALGLAGVRLRARRRSGSALAR